MSDPVFVYGTLKRGERNHDRYASDAERVETACVRGALYHMPDGYPGFRRRASGIVFGELLYFQDPSLALARLDTLEGYREADLEDSLYHRVACNARPLDATNAPVGSLLRAWIYVYAQPLPAGATMIASGRWHGGESV